MFQHFLGVKRHIDNCFVLLPGKPLMTVSCSLSSRSSSTPTFWKQAFQLHDMRKIVYSKKKNIVIRASTLGSSSSPSGCRGRNKSGISSVWRPHCQTYITIIHHHCQLRFLAVIVQRIFFRDVPEISLDLSRGG